jgi:hypothetical protein
MTSSVWVKVYPTTGPGAVGEWAKVSGGTVTTVTNPDGSVDSVHTFTANGTLTVESPGYMRILVVACGGRGNAGGGSRSGGGGGVQDRILNVSNGAIAVTVGNTSGTDIGNPSSFGSLIFCGGGGRGIEVGRGLQGLSGGGTGAATTATASGTQARSYNDPLGFASDISGSSVEYGKGGQDGVVTTIYGQGAASDAAVTIGGVVIVRVQTQAPTISGIVASGGTESTYTGDGTNGVLGQNYKVHTFTTAGNFVVTQGGEADVLIVGGGSGSAGTAEGRNGLWAEIIPTQMTLGPGSMPVVIGAGGAGGSYPGANTTFGGQVAVGGSGPTWGGPINSKVSSISGTSVTYGGFTTGNGTPANRGAGGGSPAGVWAGSSGIVVVRYPIAT